MQIARKTGLDANLRRRALELAELLVARSEAPDVQLMLSADEVGDGWLNIKSEDSTEFVASRTITEPLQKELAKAEKKWGVSGFTYSIGDQRRSSIGDVAIRGTQPVGGATLDLWFHADAGDEMIHQEEPELTGPVADVLAALPKLQKLTKWERAHEGVPAKVWPDGAHAWKPLDTWMIAEERDSMRREIAALRAAGPKQTTVGRAAHAGVLAQMVEKYGITEDAAAVLAAMILSRKFERADLAKWAGVKADTLLKHFKALIAVGLVRTHEREYALEVPVVARTWGNTAEPAFQRMFWNAAKDDREHAGAIELRFSEADVLAAFVEHVSGKKAGKAAPAAKRDAKAKPKAKAKKK
jgi:hypothetical protein